MGGWGERGTEGQGGRAGTDGRMDEEEADEGEEGEKKTAGAESGVRRWGRWEWGGGGGRAGWGWGEGRKGGLAGLGLTEQEGARGPGSLQTADGQHMRECPQKNTAAGYDRAAIAIGKQQQQDTRPRRTYKET